MHPKTSVSLILLLLLAACTAGPPPTVLVSTHWKLVSLQGKPPLAGTTITLAFASGILRTLSGSDGCNTYGGGPDSGPYQATLDGGLAITETAVTAMLCLGPPGISEQETAYMSALHQAATYRIMDGQLTIYDKTGAVLLLYETDN